MRSLEHQLMGPWIWGKFYREMPGFDGERSHGKTPLIFGEEFLWNHPQRLEHCCLKYNYQHICPYFMIDVGFSIHLYHFLMIIIFPHRFTVMNIPCNFPRCLFPHVVLEIFMSTVYHFNPFKDCYPLIAPPKIYKLVKSHWNIDNLLDIFLSHR